MINQGFTVLAEDLFDFTDFDRIQDMLMLYTSDPTPFMKNLFSGWWTDNGHMQLLSVLAGIVILIYIAAFVTL